MDDINLPPYKVDESTITDLIIVGVSRGSELLLRGECEDESKTAFKHMSAINT